MTLLQFLSRLDDYLHNSSSFIWIFVGKEYPYLFFHHWDEFLNEKLLIRAVNITEWKAHLYIPSVINLAAQRVLYWFKDVSLLSDKERQEFLACLEQHKGPFIVSFFIPETVASSLPSSGVVIKLEAVDAPTYLRLMSYYALDKRNEDFIEDCFSRFPAFSLDMAFMIMRYHQLLGKRYQEFCKEWLERVVTQEFSLFQLSGYFLGYKEHVWKEWSLQKAKYPSEFWIIFWLELLWQAITFVTIAQTVSIVEAKKNTHKLPFSFIQKDWKMHSIQQLQKAYCFLYTIDYRLKNSLTTDVAFDLFIYKFLQKGF